MPERSVTLSRLVDHAAIHHLTARFAHAVMGAEPTALGTLWSEDLEWVLGRTDDQPSERRVAGTGQVDALLASPWEDSDHSVHVALRRTIDTAPCSGDTSPSRPATP